MKTPFIITSLALLLLSSCSSGSKESIIVESRSEGPVSSISTSSATSSSSKTSKSSSSSSSSVEKTAEEKLVDYVERNGNKVLLSTTKVEGGDISIPCYLDKNLMITGTGGYNKQITSTYSVSVEYDFTWQLQYGYYTCSRHYISSNWQTGKYEDETTELTASIDYVIGDIVKVNRYAISGETRWENTIKTAADAVASDCAYAIRRIV